MKRLRIDCIYQESSKLPHALVLEYPCLFTAMQTQGNVNS